MQTYSWGNFGDLSVIRNDTFPYGVLEFSHVRDEVQHMRDSLPDSQLMATAARATVLDPAHELPPLKKKGKAATGLDAPPLETLDSCRQRLDRLEGGLPVLISADLVH